MQSPRKTSISILLYFTFLSSASLSFPPSKKELLMAMQSSMSQMRLLLLQLLLLLAVEVEVGLGGVASGAEGVGPGLEIRRNRIT